MINGNERGRMVIRMKGEGIKVNWYRFLYRFGRASFFSDA